MNQLFNLIRYIVTKIIFKRGSFTHCILISCAKQLRIFYKNFQTHSGEGIVLCIFIKYTQNMPYMIISAIHIHTKYKHGTVLQCTPFFARYTYCKYIFIYLNGAGLGGMFGGVVDIASLIACTSTTVHYIYVHIQSTPTIHEKMRMWDDV